MFWAAFARMHSRASSGTRDTHAFSHTKTVTPAHTKYPLFFLFLARSSRSRRALACYEVGCSMILYFIFSTQGAGLLRTGLLHDSIPSGRRAGWVVVISLGLVELN
jgi:hypothetical protein